MRSIALGTFAFAGPYGTVEETSSLATIHRFLDRGGQTIDTADLYGNGASETIVGEAIAGRRREVRLCTKFGFRYGKAIAERGLDARPERVEPSCDASLGRLKTDVIDVYYLHRVDPNVPIEDTVGAMAELVRKGKVRALGLCEVGPRTLERAASVHPIAAVQSEYSLWARECELFLPEFAGRGVEFMGYSPLGRGFLSGALRSPDDLPADDQRRDLPRFQGENFALNLQLVDELKRIAKGIGVTSAQLAIAWAARGNTLPIVGATEPAHVDDAFMGVSLEISPNVWESLDRIFDGSTVAGARLPEAAQRRLEGGAR